MQEQNKFKVLCAAAGLNDSDAANLLGVSKRTIYRYNRGVVAPNKSVIKLLENTVTPQKETSNHPISFRFIDLFAGIGGLRIGFQNIGGQCVFTSEWDLNAQKTYAANFRDNHPIAGDIREFSESPNKIPSHDVLLAGFPCQPFSIAGVSKKNSLGRAHGFLCDTQGTLFFDTAQIISYHKPSVFILENVKNLKSHDNGRTFSTIMNVLENELGYHVQTRVISSEYWVPQKRERIFIVGFKDPTNFNLNDLQMPNNRPKLGSILQPKEEVSAKYTLTERLWEYLQNYKKKHTLKGNGFGYSLFGVNDVARTLSARYYKDGSEVLIKQDDNRPRRLTPIECARLMGFEYNGREWKIPVSDTQAYRQFGNAVVVPVVEFLANSLKPHIELAVNNSVISDSFYQTRKSIPAE